MCESGKDRERNKETKGRKEALEKVELAFGRRRRVTRRGNVRQAEWTIVGGAHVWRWTYVLAGGLVKDHPTRAGGGGERAKGEGRRAKGEGSKRAEGGRGGRIGSEERKQGKLHRRRGKRAKGKGRRRAKVRNRPGTALFIADNSRLAGRPIRSPILFSHIFHFSLSCPRLSQIPMNIIHYPSTIHELLSMHPVSVYTQSASHQMSLILSLKLDISTVMSPLSSQYQSGLSSRSAHPQV